MESKITLAPNQMINNVSWNIGRQASGVIYGPGTTNGQLDTHFVGRNNWQNDPFQPVDGFSADMSQHGSTLTLFVIDTPGVFRLPLQPGRRFAYKAKFRQWVEVQIGGKWYVASEHDIWHTILHAKFMDAVNGWVVDTTAPKINEIDSGEGILTGFGGSYPENP